jgi:hypothetical protein
LSPGGLLGVLPDSLVHNTFERYWQEFVARRDGSKTWDAYTPYEWRSVGSFVRLGQRERALQAMEFFYQHRRPAGWNQWAEVVSRDTREPRFLGDMPHGWVASDHIRSVLDLFAYERENDGALVLGAGVPLRWFEGAGVSIAGLRTAYGALSWQARSQPRGRTQRIEFELKPLRRWPPSGVIIRGPWPAGARVFIAGQSGSRSAGDEVRLTRATPRVRIEFPR